MDAARLITLVAILINSALYATLVFVAGLSWTRPGAVIGSILCVGLCYLCPTAQLMFPAKVALHWVLLVLSIAVGVGAGLALLV